MYKKYFLKVTKDLLIVLIATYFILLVPELVLPGIVSSHFNPQYLLALILALGIIFSRYGDTHKKSENLKFQAISRNLINVVLFVITLLLILSLYKMKIWQIAIIVAIAIPILIGAEKILIKQKE